MTRQVRRAVNRGAAQTTGFTPIPNRRIQAAIAAEVVRLMEVEKLTGPEAQDRAIRTVARTLPSPRPFRHLFPRPSKSDNPVYRKAAA